MVPISFPVPGWRITIRQNPGFFSLPNMVTGYGYGLSSSGVPGGLQSFQT